MFEEQNQKSETKKRLRIWWLFVAIFFIFVFIFAGVWLIFQYQYQNRFYPGVMIGYYNVGGKNPQEVLNQLQATEKKLQDEGFKFYYQDKSIIIHPVLVAVTDPDLAKEILTFNWQATIDNAYMVGRNKYWFKNLIDQLQALFTEKKVLVVYKLDQQNLDQSLRSAFTQYEEPAKNAGLKISGNTYTITPESDGFGFQYNAAINQLKTEVGNLDFQPIQLELVAQHPAIKKSDAQLAAGNIEKILAIDSIKLTADNSYWKLNEPQFANWLEFQKNNGNVSVGLNENKTIDFLQPIAESVNVEPQDAKFKIVNNKVSEFQASRDGKHLDLQASYQKINNYITNGLTADLPLEIAVTPAKIATSDVNDMGITELVGSGTSNFAGSPTNRRKNIAVGAAAVNGTLIAPGEEFSLLKTLGEINADAGYLPELVIKGSRTVPEYGGGLCQIGTTSFRAALYSGLPITARQNHSYRVSYYEPPVGMDATIYDPAPDFKFLNDTGHYLLFITHIEGDVLTFELYGTKDGRKVEITDPVVYNITSPGEPRYIQTDQLAPGEKRKVESAHNGAEADFTYTVTYPNGEVKTTDFHSRYIAWKETWLVGIDPNAPVTNTSTDSLISTN